MDGHAANPPQHILGYTIHSRTRIYVSYLIPAALELICYIAQILADCAVSFQHFRSHQPDFGWATFSLILIPPVLTFLFVLSSRDQWTNPRHANRWHFIGYQVMCLLLFPFVAVYRLSRRVFWSIEALFQDDDDEERMRCLARAEESSTCELYHLIQAYGQSAPQIILQLYHMLTQDLFRNFETTDVQAISLFFSAIDLAAITTTYQRFESQKVAGRSYPWSPPQQVEALRAKLADAERLRLECAMKKRDSERTIASFPETDKIMANFKLRHGSDTEAEPPTISPEKDERTHEGMVQGTDEVDNEAIETGETTVLLHGPNNETDDEKIQTKPVLKLRRIQEVQQKNLDEIDILDTVPDSPAPTLPPTALQQRQQQQPHLAAPETPLLRTQVSATSDTNSSQRRDKRASKLETFADMLLVNAQLYIKEHVPRPPKILLSRIEPDAPTQEKEQMLTTPPNSPEPPVTPADVVDFFLPRPTKVVNGIQQDDFAGKVIAFFGWISFIFMRMLSLSTFCVFFPKPFFIILGVHYALMLAALFLESRFKGKLNRTLFYMLLAYVYIFVILEFRIKFKCIRLWYVAYFVITMGENITMTMIWYAREEFESWWFGFIFEGIIYSGILLVATLLVYYCILKPNDVTMVVEDKGDQDE